MDPLLIKRIVEAALLASSQPLTVVQLNGLFPLDEPAPEGGIGQALEALQAECADRGVELVEVASGWRYQVKSDVHAWVARLWTERQVKYTRATLETLALIAYRQPITRGEIEQVRGVATNSNIIKALEEREWIRVVGHRDMPGRPELLGTTKGFLDYFGLKRLDELPPLSELKDFGELEPQLPFEPEAKQAGKVGDASDASDGAMPLGDIDAGSNDADVHADSETDTDTGSDAVDATDAGNVPPHIAATDEDDALADDGDSTGVEEE
jgi:segregation and condensation protein B